MKMTHTQDNFCNHCGIHYKNYRSLYLHKYKYHKFTKRFTCKFCGETFNSCIERTDHYHEYHKPNNCLYCGTKFKDLEKHLQTYHIKGTTYHCAYCNREYQSRKSARKHLQKSKQCLDQHSLLFPGESVNLAICIRNNLSSTQPESPIQEISLTQETTTADYFDTALTTDTFQFLKPFQ